MLHHDPFQWRTANQQGMALSIGIHALLALCLGIPQAPIKPGLFPSKGAATKFSTYAIHLIPDLHEAQSVPAKQTNHLPSPSCTAFRSQKQGVYHPSKLKNTQPASHAPKPQVINKGKPAHLHKRKEAIDKRGLYHLRTGKGKQAGAMLELKGWQWDQVPKPDDTTTEYGKLIFEIKVDHAGEVVAIRTLEKTVSPLVEQIYADALRQLTFTKISPAKPYTAISTGHVTFLLVPK